MVQALQLPRRARHFGVGFAAVAEVRLALGLLLGTQDAADILLVTNLSFVEDRSVFDP
jgi:hypothetical protein